MSVYKELCRVCSDPVLSDSVEKAAHCRFRGNQDCYAALDTHLNPTSLPSAQEGSFMGPTFDRAPCTLGDSIACTILALCDSVRHLGLFVHIVEEGYSNPLDLAYVTQRSTGGKMCLVVSFSSVRDDGSRICSIYSSAGFQTTNVGEGDAIRTVLSLQRASESLVWYWSTELIGYSSMFNNSEDGLWALSFTPQSANSNTCDIEPMMPFAKGSKIRVLPFFYCTEESPSMVAMGSGGINKVCREDLTVELTALSRSIVDRAYCSSVSTGRCFCCQYIHNVHQRHHLKGRDVVPQIHRLKLTEAFWQKVKYGGKKK